MNVKQAWNSSKGDSTVVIAILDDGINYNHEDLAPNIATNPGEMGNDNQDKDKRSNGKDDDGDGYGAPGGAVDSCEAPVGFIERGDDCDDSTEAKHPGAVERCDGVDLDCDPSNATVDCPAGCSPLALESASYLVCGAVKDWPSARAFCDEMGMTLAKVRSATDQAAVEAAASPHGNIYWLGASDGLTEGTWRWETDAAGLASGFSLWAPQEPKALFDDQDCMNGYFGRWYSARCSNAYPFVCEFID